MVNKIMIYMGTFITFLLVDMVWLGFLAKDLYRRYLGDFLSEKVNWGAAISFYLLFVFGVLAFVVKPAVEKGSLKHAILYGAFFGLVTYATYDLTNLATMKGWPMQIVVIDMIWGATLTAIVSIAGFYLYRALI